MVRIAAHALVCRGPRLDAALAYLGIVYCSEAIRDSLPVGGGAEESQSFALKAIRRNGIVLIAYYCRYA